MDERYEQGRRDIAVQFEARAFEGLTPVVLYEVLALRQRVFVVEQECAYLDADGKDLASLHLLGWEDGALAAYARLLPPGVSYETASIGRVIVRPESRGRGLARRLMREAIARVHAAYGVGPITIGAQAHLEAFYASLGFVTESDPYDEDGIPHLQMRRG